MPRSSLFTYIAVIIVLIGTVSCTPVAPAPPRQNANSGILPTPDATPFLSPAPLAFQEDWKTYTAPEHGFSFRYPANLEISHYQTSGSPHISISIGEQIYIWSSDFNPLDCRGDCSPVEATEPIVIAGMEAIKVTGYIGAMEATPQRYLKYIRVVPQ